MSTFPPSFVLKNLLHPWKDIKKNTPIIIYYGEFISNKKIFFEFTKNKENYIKNIAPYLRNSGIIDQPINGKKACELD